LQTCWGNITVLILDCWTVFCFLNWRLLEFLLQWIFQGGENLSPKERRRDWVGVLMNSSFGYCDYHHDLRSNEKNVFCVDCSLRMCRHCKEAHSLHRRFQIYKYSYQDVFRHAELQKYFDCSKIQVLSLSQDSKEFIEGWLNDWFSADFDQFNISLLTLFVFPIYCAWLVCLTKDNATFNDLMKISCRF